MGLEWFDFAVILFHRRNDFWWKFQVAQVANMGAVQQTTLLLERTYSELFDLIVEARDYLEASQRARLRRQAARPVPAARFVAPGRLREHARTTVARIDEAQLSCETMRMTSRLTQAMAWVMVQKAVHCGELTSAEACEERYRLGGQEVCLTDAYAAHLDMPPRLRQLMDRSLTVYQRIERLDRMLDADCRPPERRSTKPERRSTKKAPEKPAPYP